VLERRPVTSNIEVRVAVSPQPSSSCRQPEAKGTFQDRLGDDPLRHLEHPTSRYGET